MTIFAIMLFIAGITLIISPNLVFTITQSWKSGNASEPSALYKMITRVQGVILVVVAVVLLV